MMTPEPFAMSWYDFVPLNGSTTACWIVTLTTDGTAFFATAVATSTLEFFALIEIFAVEMFGLRALPAVEVLAPIGSSPNAHTSAAATSRPPTSAPSVADVTTAALAQRLSWAGSSHGSSLSPV